MPDRPSRPARRRFVHLSASLAAAGLLGTRAAQAARVPLDDPQAQALGYTESSTTDGQRCRGCVQFQGGDADWGPCQVFGGREVPATGWCRAWTARGG